MTILHRWRAVLCLLSITAGACTTASRTPKGVLVGLTSGRTLWIALHNDSAHLVTEKPQLVVPREDGMWWAGVVARCVIEENDSGWVEDSIFVQRTDAVFVTRAGDEPRVSLEGVMCDEAEQEVLELRGLDRKEIPAPDSLVPAEELISPETFYCDISSRRITFASPTVLSVEGREIGTEFCSPAKYSTFGKNRVIEFSSDRRILLRPLLSNDARTRVEQLFADTAGCGYTDDENASARADSTWAIRRERGAWVAQLWVDGPVACRGGYETEEGEPLPHTFTGDAPLPMSWSELVRQIPNALDAAASASGEYILVHKADSLILFRWNGTQLGSPLLRVDIGYEVELAMIRWATPDETRRWNVTLPGLVPPRLQVIPEAR